MKAILLGGPMDGELFKVGQRAVDVGIILMHDRTFQYPLTMTEVEAWNTPIPIWRYRYVSFSLPGKYGTELLFFVCEGKN